MKRAQIEARLRELAAEYPEEITQSERKDVPRIAFNIQLALDGMAPEEARVCDIGGGIGLFSVGCAALGVRAMHLVDDLDDPINHEVGDAVLQIHRRHGVQVHRVDPVAQGLEAIQGELDVVTTFDSMEHWHNSPRRLLDEVIRRLRPGGRFVLGVPNCVNLRKRIAVPLGRAKWSAFDDWFHQDTFRGHVREPDVDDLHRIARHMGLGGVKIWGRNWLGYYSASPLTRLGARLFDYPLRLRPTLCSDIYMVGTRP